MQKLICIEEARRSGAKRYFTGVPCKYGHIAERYVSDGNCAACKEARKHMPSVKASHIAACLKWRKKNHERVLELQRNRRYRDPRYQMLAGSKYRAKQRKLEWDLKVGDIQMPVDGCCPILGIKLAINEGASRAAPTSPSLDRIDSGKGYVRGNVQVISWRANSLKNNSTPEEIKALYQFQTAVRHKPVERDWLYV